MAKKEESVTKLNINFFVMTWQRSNIAVHKAKRLTDVIIYARKYSIYRVFPRTHFRSSNVCSRHSDCVSNVSTSLIDRCVV